MRAGGIQWLIIPVLAALLAWACGSEANAGVKNINLSVVNQTLYGGRADRLIPVKQGDRVNIHITADEPMAVFLHGYDVEVRVKPGTGSDMQFTADVAGRFALMIHSLGEDEGNRIEILLGLVDILPRK